MIRLVLLTLLTGAAIVAARADTMRTYANPRFGATAEVPSDWRADPPPENGDGQRFSSPDGLATITISGILNLDDNVEAAMREEEEPGAGETITYRQRSGRALITSGTRGMEIFYRKAILVCADRIWNHVSLEYPAAQKAHYDSLVARIAGSLRFAGSSWQITDCR
jgi:hypothetical protein